MLQDIRDMRATLLTSGSEDSESAHLDVFYCAMGISKI